MTGVKKRRLLVGLGLIVLLSGCFAAGLALGSSEAETEQAVADQRHDALELARGTAYESAFAAARSGGERKGTQTGERAGEADGSKVGMRAGAAAADEHLAAEEAAAAEADQAAAKEEAGLPVICDGAVADDAQYAACLEQSGEAIPPGFPGGPSGCPSEPPFPIEGPCANLRP